MAVNLTHEEEQLILEHLEVKPMADTTYQERLDKTLANYKTARKTLRNELLVQPILEYWSDKWSLNSEDPQDPMQRYSSTDWTAIRFYLSEQDTTKDINLFIETLNSDPRIKRISNASEAEKHVSYAVTTTAKPDKQSWQLLSFSIYFYFDRSKYCHAKVTKVEYEHDTWENKTYNLVCS